MQLPQFNKVIVWGYPLGGHTHSNVHDAFYRAFKILGYDAYHVENDKENHDRFCQEPNCLYLTSSGADSEIPLRDDCSYITHNCGPLRYLDKRHVKIQVLTFNNKDAFNQKQINDFAYYDKHSRTLYMLWATNLLPDEFDFDVIDTTKENKIWWVGTISGEGDFENKKNIDLFKKACAEHNVEFLNAWDIFGGQVSPEQNIELIRKSYMAPTIVGTWQHKVGFVPCRLFKNTSYGRLPITNSPYAKQIFGDLCVHNDDPYQLFFDALDAEANKDRVVAAMKIVKEKHTYVNRVLDIFQVL